LPLKVASGPCDLPAAAYPSPVSAGEESQGRWGSAFDQASPDVVTLAPSHRIVVAVVVTSALTAIAVPFPATKMLVGAVLGLVWLALLCDLDERFLGLYVLVLPVLQLVPIETMGLTAFNWQTVFLILFVWAILMKPAELQRVALSWWIATFSVLLCVSAIQSWMVQGLPFAPLFAQVKDWLFPFILFVAGRRYFRDEPALWFLVVCIALVSFAQAMHALREVLMTSNLLRHRPIGMLTGQANLFGGYLAIYGLICLFTARCVQLSRGARLRLFGTGLALTAVLILTLSRGAWMAFAVTALAFGAATNRRLVVMLLVALAVGYRWIPEEAFQRTETTLTAVELSGDASLEEAMDASAALRIIQWKAFPEMLMEHPVWGSGLTTYPSRLGELVGVYRSAHATMIQIGTEIGVLGLVAYLGLLTAATSIAARRAYRASKGSLNRSVGLGLAAATVCLFLLDFTGSRFRANTVTSYYWLLLGAFLGATDGAPPAKTTEAQPV
jgi:O-antigen ligase